MKQGIISSKKSNFHDHLLVDGWPNREVLNRTRHSKREMQSKLSQNVFICLVFALQISIVTSSHLSEEKWKTLVPVRESNARILSSSNSSATVIVKDPHSEGSPNNEPKLRASANLATRLPTTRELISPYNNSTNGRERNSQLAQTTKQKALIDLNHLFREETENYPDEEIRVALKKTPEELKELYNVINTPLDPNMNLTERVAHYYSEDDNESSREEHICRSVTRNIFPREARRENTLVYVPNNQDFMQVIQAELCQNPEEECNYLSDNLPHGMISICHQKYSYKKLMYFDSLKSRMASDLFRYPSCCACYVRTSLIDLRSAVASNNSSSIGGAKISSSTIRPTNEASSLGPNKVAVGSLGIEKPERSAYLDEYHAKEASNRDVSINKRLDKASNSMEEEERAGTMKGDFSERSGKFVHIVNDDANGNKLKEASTGTPSFTSTSTSTSTSASSSSASSSFASSVLPNSALLANNSSHLTLRSQARVKNLNSESKFNQSNVNQTIILPEDKVYKSSNLHRK